jgi:hypothetical protein
MRNITETDIYYPLLLVLKCYHGKVTKPEIADALAMVMRKPRQYHETPSGAKTQETHFIKALN